jgi:hypothetical protein
MSQRHWITHALAVKKLATAKAVADLLAIDEATVAAELDALVQAKKAVSARGAFMLTPDAQRELKVSYAETYAELRTNVAFNHAYDRFEVVNRELKQLVTDWQTIEVAGEHVPNDHSNHVWDEQCIDKLGALHERSEKVLSDFAATLPRLGAYAKRLESALDKLEAGNSAYFSAPKIDSYHTVWFELHEDLLRLLGRTRDE